MVIFFVQGLSRKVNSRSADLQITSYYETWEFIAVFTEARCCIHLETDESGPHLHNLFL
jgi:hypothetical protein